MLQANVKCPHCGNEGTFDFYGIPVVKHVKFGKLPSGKETEVLLIRGIAICCKCEEPTLIEAHVFRNEWEVFKNHINTRELYKISNFKIVRVLPPPKEPYTHPSIPEKVRDLLKEAQELLNEGRSPSIIVGACRSILEVALKELNAEGDTLYDKIEDLYQRHIITTPLRDWSHIVRKMGNKALHEIEASSEDAQELVEFTKLFLMMTFELPAKIREKRSR